MRIPTTWPVLVLAILVAAPAAAAEGAGAAPNSVPEPREFVTRHSLEVGGEMLRYRAVAGETYLHDAQGEPEASIFSFSYLLEGVDDPRRRPVAFFFNGGPGSTAVWLHLGGFGPRRLILEDAANPGAPPYELAANPRTLLPVTDLVFVDPIGTGYSRALGEHQDADYWGVDEDAAVLARFIHAWLARHRRWGSPKYLVGESYAGFRVAVLVRELQLNLLDSTPLNGVVLIAPALDVRAFVTWAPGNDLGCALILPSFTAVAHYHDRLPDRPADLEALLTEAREFAATDYLTALFQGDSLSPERARAIAAELHRFTGLSEEYLLRSNLRVDLHRFVKELLRDQGKVVATIDGRYVGRDPDDTGETVTWEPFILSMPGPFVTAINEYLAAELDADFGRRYEILRLEIPGAWRRPPESEDWRSGTLNAVPYLAEAAAANQDFRIFVGSGYHDLSTPFFGIEYTFDHSGIDKDRITLRNYFAGHMMYLHDPSLEKLSTDLKAFIAGRPR